MKCPKCSGPAKRVSLDRYGCTSCGRQWLIHELTTYYADFLTFDRAMSALDNVEEESS